MVLTLDGFCKSFDIVESFKEENIKAELDIKVKLEDDDLKSSKEEERSVKVELAKKEEDGMSKAEGTALKLDASKEEEDAGVISEVCIHSNDLRIR